MYEEVARAKQSDVAWIFRLRLLWWRWCLVLVLGYYLLVLLFGIPGNVHEDPLSLFIRHLSGPGVVQYVLSSPSWMRQVSVSTLPVAHQSQGVSDKE